MHRFPPFVLTVEGGVRIMRTSDGRGVEQLAARRAHNPEVAGSNPAPATKYDGQLQFAL